VAPTAARPSGARGERTLVVTPDGVARRLALDADRQAALWARLLHAGRPGLVEVVAGRRLPDGSLRMRSRNERGRYPRAGDAPALVALVRRHREAGEEVFCTPLTRRLARPGRGGQVLPAAVAWVDIDERSNIDRVRVFPHPPNLVVYSGSGGAHAYWRVGPAVAPEELEAANRRLAGALGGDLASCDRARIMRLPGSDNHKAGRPCRLAYLDLTRAPVPLARLCGGLEDPDPPPPPPDPAILRRWARWNAADDARRIPPPVYFLLLCGLAVPEAGGDVRCPLPDHDEQNPSCRVYPRPEQGWVCFGCQRGGTIYDLASLLAGGPGGRRGALHGKNFIELKRRVRELLGLEQESREERP
jgi:hypothetical protein